MFEFITNFMHDIKNSFKCDELLLEVETVSPEPHEVDTILNVPLVADPTSRYEELFHMFISDNERHDVNCLSPHSKY